MREGLRLVWAGFQVLALAGVTVATFALQNSSPLSAGSKHQSSPQLDKGPSDAVAAMRQNADIFGTSERERLVRVEMSLESIREDLEDIKTHLAQHSDWILYLLAALFGVGPAKELVTGIQKARHKNGRRQSEES